MIPRPPCACCRCNGIDHDDPLFSCFIEHRHGCDGRHGKRASCNHAAAHQPPRPARHPEGGSVIDPYVRLGIIGTCLRRGDPESALAAVRDLIRDAESAEFVASFRETEWQGAERALELALQQLAEVRTLAVQWSEEAGDYVPPLPPDEPYNLMVDHSAALLKIVGDTP